MSMADEIDALAGEYVIGTLTLAERTAVTARRQREPELDAAIRAWEHRLAPLDSNTQSVPPPGSIWHQVEQRLDATAAHTAMLIDVVQLNRRLRRWQYVAATASAIAASLILYVGLQQAFNPPMPQSYVAVFQKDDVLPSFYLTIDLKSRELTVRPVNAEQHPGKTYQLWIASDQLGPAPQSLGLVDTDLRPTRKTLASFDPQLLQKATFGVSLEPAGGSPTGRPTSPALHAKLLPATN